MSSPASFDILLEVSRTLDDDFIDEDISEIQIGDREVSNRTVTVRGKRNGHPLVLSYQDYYSTVIDPLRAARYEGRILEAFVAQPKVSFEGRIKRRGLLDKIARWVGGGGTKGPHPIFERMRLDAEGPVNASSFHHADFGKALERLALRADVRRVLLQSGAGLAAVVRWHAQSSSPQFVLELIDQVTTVARALDQQ